MNAVEMFFDKTFEQLPISELTIKEMEYYLNGKESSLPLLTKDTMRRKGGM